MLRATCGPLKRKVALLFLLTIRPAISTPGAFDVDFTKNVAPAAKNSLDDKSRLPAQVCGIIGAYLAFVFLVGVSLLTFGRKMRRAVHERIDVVKANQSNGFELSPMSPGSTARSRWWAPQSPSRLKQAFKRNPGTTNPESVPTSPLSATESMASFDQHFLRNQQEQRQREMEKLYAAVMEHDEERRKQKILESAEELADEDGIQKAAREAVQSPARLNTNSLYPPSPASPSPQSPVHAIHSSGGSRRQFSGPPPTLREGQGLGTPQEEPQSLSPRGFFSRARTPSYGSSESKPRRSIRNLRISSPIPRFSAAERDEEARTPLSPRHYTPGPPPEPPSATTTPTAPARITTALRHTSRCKPPPLPPPPRCPSSSTARPTTTRRRPPCAWPPRRTPSRLRTPGTAGGGVPMTPYSPYMPFTPVTPVTPHLVTRKERKMREKEERKARGRAGVVDEEDEVGAVDWGDAY
ncbi:hypothetical protein IWX90DRAFT_383696 [Phyllosticta citrichinensis]|uniref:Uncharacterized protein n=1 Tax=Phyllosticta citrichinensis TaxID=1130410 RepID=A0ABR1XVG3_9PEZI